MKNPTVPAKETSDPRCGGALRIRPLSATDEEKLRGMLARLSEKSIYRRFHTPYPDVPKWVVSSLSNTNRDDTESLVAVAEGEIVSHAMFVKQGAEAEFAVVVEDRWQSRGIGRSLLIRLALEAERRGVETLTATVLGENRRVLGLLEAAFPEVERRIKDGAYHVRVPSPSLGSTSKSEESGELIQTRRGECLACSKVDERAEGARAERRNGGSCGGVWRRSKAINEGAHTPERSGR